MAASPFISSPVQSPRFDKQVYLKHMDKSGRAYRNQAMELISICRRFTFSRTAEHIFTQDDALSEVLQACDIALACIAKAGLTADSTADQRIKEAIRKLHDYEQTFHPPVQGGAEGVEDRMGGAANRDVEELEQLRPFISRYFKITKTKYEWSRVVNFHLMTSITDPRPTIVRQVITNCSNLSEILWNFKSYPHPSGCVTLVENPYFYHRRHLPITSPNASKDGLIIYPMDYFQDQDTKDISVLTSKPGRVLLGLGDNSQAYDQVWRANGILILKNICGRLESESAIEAVVQDRSCRWCLAGPLPPRPEKWETVRDWKEAIHHVLLSQDVKIRVTIVSEPVLNRTRSD